MGDQALARRRALWVTLALAAASILAGLIRALNTRRDGAKAAAPPTLAPDLVHFPGLSEEEARSRRSSRLADERAAAAREVRRDIWRSSAISIFNLGLVGLAAAQAMLGDPLSALLTVGILIFNIVVSAAQQLYATNRVEKLLEQARPMATVIRDGLIRSLDVDNVVVGDTLIAGPGDQFVAGGRLLDGRPQMIEATAIGGLDEAGVLQPGERVREGSYCLRGRAIYRADALPGLMGDQHWTPVQEKTELTYLQRIMARVLRLMLLLIAIFLALLVLDKYEWPILGTVFEDLYREAASIFFSIAPSGLYFMIVATYALGSARLGGAGALIRDARAVEALAQISVLCFSRAGTLTGADVQIEMIDWLDGKPALSESRTRQILGDFSHSVRGNNVFLKAVQDKFRGSHRPATETAELLSIYGWMAITFAEADLRGTYVIGLPEILETRLAHPPEHPSPAPDAGEESAGQFEPADGGETPSGFLGWTGGLLGQARQRPDTLVQQISEQDSPQEEPADPGPHLLFATPPSRPRSTRPAANAPYQLN